MAYTVALPDGRTVEFPDNVPHDKAAEIIRAQFPGLGTDTSKAESGFIPAVKSGWAGLKGDIAAVAGRTGVMDEAAAEKYRAEQAEYQKKTFKPTEKGWTEAPVSKTLELLGQSVPYMAAPLAAGAVAPGGLAALGAAGVASALQFTGSNLSRQTEEGKKLSETDLGAAAVAAIPQAALDMVSFKMLPGIRQIFAKAGVDLSEQAARNIAKEGLKKTAFDYGASTAKTMGSEGLTEAGQQVLERMQAGLALTDEKARAEYWDSLVGGAVLGGVLAPAGRYMERGKEQETYDAQQAAAQRAAAAKEPPPPAEEAPAAPEAPAEVSVDDLILQREALKQLPYSKENRREIQSLSKQITAMFKARSEEETQRLTERGTPMPSDIGEGPAAKSAEVFTGEQMEIPMPRERVLEPLPPETDLLGEPLRPRAEQSEGLADVIGAELPATTEVLQDAGLAPTRKELEAAGQQRITAPLVPLGAGKLTPLPAGVAEPKLRAPAAPVTPTAVPAIVGDDTFKALGIGPTANIRKSPLVGMDITKPEDAAQVKRDLTVYREASKSDRIKANIDAYLGRPEFQGLPDAAPTTPTTPTTVEPKPAAQLGRSEPSVAVSGEPTGAPSGAAPTTGEPAAPVGRGLVPAGQPAESGVSAEGAPSPALTAEEEAAAAQKEREEYAALQAKLAAQKDKRRGVRVSEPAPAKPAAPVERPTLEEDRYLEPESIYQDEDGAVLRRSPQGTLLPTTEKEGVNLVKARERAAKAAPAVEAEPTAQAADERQRELDFTAKPKATKPKAAKTKAPPTSTEVEEAPVSDTVEPSAAEMQAAIEGKPLIEVAQWVAENLPKGYQKLIARRVLQLMKQVEQAGITFLPLRVTKDGYSLTSGARGVTTIKNKRGERAATVEIVLNSPSNGASSGVNPVTVLHELVHAATMSVIQLGQYKSNRGSALGAKTRELQALHNAVIDHFNERVRSGAKLTEFEQAMFNRQNNAMADMDETLAWGLTSPDAQAYLETIPYKGTTVWNKFVTMIRDLLGLPAKADTALAELLRVSDRLFDVKAPEIEAARVQSGLQYQRDGKKAPSTESAAFKKWFGSSKVVNADGKPMVVYHGMPSEMEGGVFRESTYGTLGKGIYFTSDPVAAGKFATGVRGTSTEPKAQGSVVPVYLKMEQPFDDEFFVGNQPWQDWAASIVRDGNPDDKFWASNAASRWMTGSRAESMNNLKAIHDKLVNGKATLRDLLFIQGGNAETPWGRKILEQVKDHGAFDGVILKASAKGFDEYVVFKPEQAKSAIGNIGTYEATNPDIRYETKKQFQISHTVQQLVDGAGAVDQDEKSALRKLVDGFKTSPDVSLGTKFRTQVADIAATIESRLSKKFDGAVRDSLGELNPMGLYRQAQDYTKMLLTYFQKGALVKDPTTGQWVVSTKKGVRAPAEVYEKLKAWGDANGMSMEQATKTASRVLEGVRLDAMRTANKRDKAGLTLHKIDKTSALSIDQQIDEMLAVYNSEPALKEMSKLMDEARIELVDHMVAVGRLSAEQGKLWREVAGYVPFDRLSPETLEKFSRVKKVGARGLAQIGKLPELVGSVERPVGNVFDNYLDTLGWMVGQVVKTDATVQTLRSLEKVGSATYLGKSSQNKPNTVGMYVKGELNYWELPSKYDVMAFKDLNAPKQSWLLQLGAFSNLLRKSITALPPFALKQVTDDVQRAIMYSGVKNPGALLRMALTNFPKMAYAELRGIEHPAVTEFGAMGLTGEYDFQAGKPAASLLKDLGYKKRSKFETLIHRLDGITRASDLAVRKAIYDQSMKETQGDQLLSQTRAREFINFRRRGNSEFVGAMVTTIPFFNAYVQGMDVLYRAASGKDSSSSIGRAEARRLFRSRAAIVTTLAFMYALGKDDDDERYKDMDLRTRDSNWIFGDYKLAVPGELGAIFKVIPERVVEYMKRQGTPEEQTASEAVRTALTYMLEQYVGRVTPVPQAAKPLLEAWGNKSFLTGRQLEGFHHRTMDPSMRTTEGTSELAKAIANFSRDVVGTEVSPIMIDNTLRGYFGSTAALLTTVTDSLLNPTRTDRPLHKWALLSNYLTDPIGNRRMTEFYEERESMGKANATLNELTKTDLDKAEAYAVEHQDELVFEKYINSTLNELEKTRAYRKFLNSPEGAKEMSSSEREAAMQEVKQYEQGLVGWLREAKTEYNKSR